MPRDVNGNYTLPAGNPVVTGTTIASSWGNNSLNDVAAALTNSLDRTGASTGMTGQFKAVNGNAAGPGISFNAELNSGLYRAAAGDIRLAILGVDVVQFNNVVLPTKTRTAAEITAGVTPVNFQYAPDPIADPRRYGAVLNGTTDDTNAFNQANLVLAVNGGILQFSGTPYINGNVTIPKNVLWDGGQGNPGIDNPVVSGTYLQSGTILLNPSFTITCGNKGGIRRATILNKQYAPGGAFPLPFTGAVNATNGVAAFSGTALTGGGDDHVIENVLILCFAQAVSTSGFERPRYWRIYGDCTAGILIDTVTDILKVSECEFWEFTTTHQSWTTTTLLTRTGSGFKTTTNHVDAGMFERCFAFGYAIDFDIASRETMDIIGCFADGPTAGTGQIGFKFSGNADLINVVGGGSSGVDQGMYVNVTPGGAAGAIKVIGMSFWGNHTHIVSDQHKTLLIQSCMLRDTNGGTNIGITVNGSVTGVTSIQGNSFQDQSNCVSLAAGAIESCVVKGNVYYNCTGGIPQERDFAVLTTAANWGQPVYTGYNSGLNGYSITYRYANGTPGSPSVAPSNSNAFALLAQAYDSANFIPLAGMRFTVRGAPAAGAVKGGIVWSVNLNSNVTTDVWGINEVGTLFPNADVTYSLGSPTNRLKTLYTGEMVSDTVGLGFYSVVTGQAQPTTAGAAGTRVSHAGNTMTDADTIDGYTLLQVVKALRTIGLLA